MDISHSSHDISMLIHISWTLNTLEIYIPFHTPHSISQWYISFHMIFHYPIHPIPYFMIPSGKRLHNYGTTPFLLGKSTISMAIFNSFLYVHQRLHGDLPSGSLTVCYRKWSAVPDLPIKMGIFSSYVSLPEGIPIISHDLLPRSGPLHRGRCLCFAGFSGVDCSVQRLLQRPRQLWGAKVRCQRLGFVIGYHGIQHNIYI